MLNEILIKIYNRDLEKLKDEINSYHHEKNLWIINRDITNSAGNLCLHIVGNLNAFIGTVLGNTNYKRQRDLEFSLKDVPRSTLIQQVKRTSTEQQRHQQFHACFGWWHQWRGKSIQSQWR